MLPILSSVSICPFFLNTLKENLIHEKEFGSAKKCEKNDWQTMTKLLHFKNR